MRYCTLLSLLLLACHSNAGDGPNPPVRDTSAVDGTPRRLPTDPDSGVADIYQRPDSDISADVGASDTRAPAPDTLPPAERQLDSGADALRQDTRPATDTLPVIEEPEVQIPAGRSWTWCNSKLFYPGGSCDTSSYGRCYHQVEMSSFSIDQFEVTQKNYQTCVNAGKCSIPVLVNAVKSGSLSAPMLVEEIFTPTATPQLPVFGVSWEQASQYCAWRGKQLPTSAQWEYAARGVDGQSYSWGNESPSCTATRVGSADKPCTEQQSSPAEVGSYDRDKSPFGVMDMVGNVDEWVRDANNPYFYWTSACQNSEIPQDPYCSDGGTGGVSNRVVRGAGYRTGAEGQESMRLYLFSFQSDRMTNTSAQRGFRCAR